MRTLRRSILCCVALVLAVAAVAAAHDLFIRPRSFFLKPGETVRMDVLNGTFEKSEAALAFNRLADIRVVGPAGTTRPDSSAWRVHGDSTELTWVAGDAGTYVVGAAVLPRELTLSAEQFNAYLKEDGIPDVLEARRKNDELSKSARERYAKNVKTLLQVGDAHSRAFATVLGHAAELVPLENPYALRPGAALRVRALVDGSPVAGQLVLAGGVGSDGARIAEAAARTGSDGVATVRLSKAGHWYVKFIHMVKATGESSIDYRSKWATLTFGVR
ncbi:MAG TPA: DUF4198 domain-containing protein [Gemmatimonadaceae bacterium]|nr:DUF4198 domain-containing protein [Gemmatimonadaceae bacterium]